MRVDANMPPIKDPTQIYGLIQFMIRAKEDSKRVEVLFDANAASFGRSLARELEGKLWRRLLWLLWWPRPVRTRAFELTADDPLFEAALTRLCALLENDRSIRRFVLEGDRGELIRRYFSPFTLDFGAHKVADIRVGALESTSRDQGGDAARCKTPPT